MKLRAHIDKVSTFISSKGHDVEIALGEPASTSELAAAASRLGISAFPPTISDFFGTFANGMQIRWLTGEEEDSSFANVIVLPLNEAIDQHEKAKEYNPIWDEAYKFPYCKCPSLALQTAMDCRNYLNVIDEGNGDAIAIDLRFGIVRFNSHDWFDGGIGANGWIMSSSLEQFLTTWSQRCFQVPKSLDWSTTLRPHGVDWNSDDFDRDFSLTASVWA